METDPRLARSFSTSAGFLLGLRAGYEQTERRRAIADELEATTPRAG